MAIKELEVWVTLTGRTVGYYESKKYEIPKKKGKSGLVVDYSVPVLVKVEDLLPKCSVMVTKICDECEIPTPEPQTYLVVSTSREKNGGIDRCRSHAAVAAHQKRLLNLAYEKSLEFFAKNNNLDYLVQEYSDENSLPPSKIPYSYSKNVLWNCPICNKPYQATVHNRTGPNKTCCPYHGGHKVLAGYNDLWTTHPQIAQLLVNPDKGKELSAGSHEREEFLCPNCDHISPPKKICLVVRNGFSCSKCGDGISYPEKLIFNVLKQLQDLKQLMEFEFQKVFSWSKGKRFDFYIKQLKCIIETHGGQHEIGGWSSTAKEIQENDQDKKDLAIKEKGNVEHYIIIDCSKSILSYIKDEVLKSPLNLFFDLSNIDWTEAHNHSVSSWVKVACEHWNDGIKSTVEIAYIMGLHHSTAHRYLRQGKELGLVDYDPKEVQRKNGKTNGTASGKPIVQLSLGDKLIKEWPSARKAASELHISPATISKACNGKYATATTCGFKWMFKKDYEKLFLQ
ncbi:zinc-ribbon domain-containing protein [Neobacillus rhizosphaerae]|uniref:zinc-ribbon domain-containing protein n=1 Tax=Neobacillus rhizosphaerae TaxID=2880965 RepID=UPI003D27F079